MSTTLTLNQRLSIVHQALKVPKGQTNTFGGYKYRNAEDILEAVKPLLAKYELVLTLSDELVNIGERYYIKATAQVYPTDGVGTFIEVTAYAREEETKKGMDGSQITGASSSYARKYALNGLFLIDDTKDSDATNDHGKDKKAEEAIDQAGREGVHDVAELLTSDIPSPTDRARKMMVEQKLTGAKATEFIQSVLKKDKPDTDADAWKLIAELTKRASK